MKVFKFPLRVYYEDTDLLGIVYHANYIKFFERARTAMFREGMGYSLTQLREEHDLQFAIRNLQVDYVAPSRFDDRLEVATSVTKITAATLVFNQKIVNLTTENATVAIAKFTVMSLSAVLKPKRLPGFLKEAVIATM